MALSVLRSEDKCCFIWKKYEKIVDFLRKPVVIKPAERIKLRQPS
ncbi:hypothetical protein BUTYVIB_00501 [Eshraghiella crossota DSM 2876]|uniref:Uncharacterized protein n=1 Tax=Eshraghiella crossota DSM 2876 TaxID=511680 RepID=D4RXF0_9FIRM|nr:hypothetical protein BUTYVIB_00501 [Butyrivibrio crossotus DSM 2876]